MIAFLFKLALVLLGAFAGNVAVGICIAAGRSDDASDRQARERGIDV